MQKFSLGTKTHTQWLIDAWTIQSWVPVFSSRCVCVPTRSYVSWSSWQNKDKTVLLQSGVIHQTVNQDPVTPFTLPLSTRRTLVEIWPQNCYIYPWARTRSWNYMSKGSQLHIRPHLMKTTIPFMKNDLPPPYQLPPEICSWCWQTCSSNFQCFILALGS